MRITDFEIQEDDLYFFIGTDYYKLKYDASFRTTAPYFLNHDQYGNGYDLTVDAEIELDFKGLFVYNDDLDEFEVAELNYEHIRSDIEEWLIDNYLSDK